MKHTEQICKIKEKLLMAQKADPDFRVFGASSHQYQLGNPADEKEVVDLEQRYGVSLPSSYREFITTIGNGGVSVSSSAAGPYYGIYPLGENIEEYIYEPEEYLSKAPNIHPGITEDEWDQLCARINEDDEISDEDYDKEMGKLFSGLLPVGSQGCSYSHALVLNGPHAGKVVNIDLNLEKPKFCYEDHFLDWYERWLDEIIDGTLLQPGANWFGYTVGGNGDQLIQKFENAATEAEKEAILIGFYKLQSISAVNADSLVRIFYNATGPVRRHAAQVLLKFDYEKAAPLIRALINGDDGDVLAASQGLFDHAKKRADEWFDLLAQRLSGLKDGQAMRYVVFVMLESGRDFGELVLPFTTNSDEKIRESAFYALGHLNRDGKYMKELQTGLVDESSWVVATILQALEGKDCSALQNEFMGILERFRANDNFVLSRLMRLIEGMGGANSGLLALAASHEDPATADLAKHLLKN